MLPTIRDKSFLEIDKNDLQILINNPAYMENEYIDYKRTYEHFNMPRGDEKEAKKVEFKNDVCSFANAEGGYIIIGIAENKGCASKILGIEIKNTDRFETNCRTDLAAIHPKVPGVKFHFIEIDPESSTYVVIIFIKHDSFAPYTHIYNQSDYKFYKRNGNGKSIMTYTELRNMFNQSLSLEKEVYNYRLDRINHYKKKSTSEPDLEKFMILHFIPETFQDSSYNQNMYVLNKYNGIAFSSIFSTFGCSQVSMPCVDGIRFLPHSSKEFRSECHVYNNGIVECYSALNSFIHTSHYDDRPILNRHKIWKDISDTINSYKRIISTLTSDNRIFIAISIIGCQGLTTDQDEITYFSRGEIDRQEVVCEPVVIQNINDTNELKKLVDRLQIEFYLSMGAVYNDELQQLIDKVYFPEKNEENSDE